MDVTPKGSAVSISTAINNTENKPKKKLPIKGLKSFLKTHGGPACPPSWLKDFPNKSKFHVDKYVYDFEEGPKAPRRPNYNGFPPKKRSGRCDTCGTFSIDTCRCCKKCPFDCSCPKPPINNIPDIMGTAFGPGWSRTNKLICEMAKNANNISSMPQKLTEDERRAPVGRKPDYSCGDWIPPRHLQCQIDVMNPSRTPENIQQGYNPGNCNAICSQPPPQMPSYPMMGYPHPLHPQYYPFYPPPTMYPAPMFCPPMMPTPMYMPPPPPIPPPYMYSYPDQGQFQPSPSPYGPEPPSNYF